MNEFDAVLNPPRGDGNPLFVMSSVTY